MAQTKSFIDSIPVVKKQLVELCRQITTRKLRTDEFTAAASSLMKHNSSPHLLGLLRRLELTCGMHFCEIWTECEKRCKYWGVESTWRQEVGELEPFF